MRFLIYFPSFPFFFLSSADVGQLLMIRHGRGCYLKLAPSIPICLGKRIRSEFVSKSNSTVTMQS